MQEFIHVLCIYSILIYYIFIKYLIVLFNSAGGSKYAYLGEVGTEEFLQKLTSQITEMVSAKMTQGKSEGC